MDDLIKIVAATLTGMDVDVFRDEVVKWIAEARDPRWKRPYTDLVYLPQIELLRFLRANGFKTFIVTGGGQDFVRAYAERVYGVPRDQVVGTAGAVKYQYDSDGRPVLIKEPKLLLNDDKAGKPEGIHLMIGRRPRFAFGNSERRPRDVRIYDGGRRRAPGDARPARRRRTRICLRAGAGPARQQDRHVPADALRRGARRTAGSSSA